MEKGGIEDLFKKQVPRSPYRRYNATKHLITFYNGSNLFFGHVKTDADLLHAQKEDNELFLDVCESFRYGVMSYGSEQATRLI